MLPILLVRLVRLVTTRLQQPALRAPMVVLPLLVRLVPIQALLAFKDLQRTRNPVQTAIQ